MNATILNVTEDEYHADPCDAPSLSASVASVLISTSSAHAHAIHPRLGGVRKPPTREMDRGSLIHRLLLDAGADLAVIDAPDYKTKAAREERDAARASGCIPVLAHKLEDAQETVVILRQRIADLDLGIDLGTGHRESAICWQSDTIHGPITCRSMLDWHDDPASGLIVDLKTAGNAHPAALERACADRGYAIQDAAYREAFTALYPQWLGRERFLFIFCELEPPHAVQPAELSGSFRQLGFQQWDRAKTEWAWSITRDNWPGYGPEIVRLEAPPWAMRDEMMEEAS